LSERGGRKWGRTICKRRGRDDREGERLGNHLEKPSNLNKYAGKERRKKRKRQHIDFNDAC